MAADRGAKPGRWTSRAATRRRIAGAGKAARAPPVPLSARRGRDRAQTYGPHCRDRPHRPSACHGSARLDVSSLREMGACVPPWAPSCARRRLLVKSTSHQPGAPTGHRAARPPALRSPCLSAPRACRSARAPSESPPSSSRVPYPRAVRPTVTHRLAQNSTPGCDQNKANFNSDARKNAASRGGHRALAIPQSFLHTPSDANPACDGHRPTPTSSEFGWFERSNCARNLIESIEKHRCEKNYGRLL